MDVDAFAAVHEPEWQRLAQLAGKRTLSGRETDELISRYQSVAGQLSSLHTSAPDPRLVARLSTVLADARAKIAGSHEPRLSDLTRFVTLTLPAAFYRVRWWTVWVMVAFLVIATASAWWLATTPEAMAELGSPAELEHYAEEAFEAYYSDFPAGDFAGQVWTNNAWLAAQAIGLGISGFFPVYVLFNNAVGVGSSAAIMSQYGSIEAFFGLILPHGLMELTAIFIAAGTGLKLFWALVAPGRRTRSRALVEEGLTLITVAIGLVVVLAVSGVVEGFVTPSSLPTGVKITIGALVLAGYWAYTLTLGRRAVRAGEMGDLEPDLAGYTVAQAG